MIPPILSGRDVTTGFSTDALSDAYNMFNAITAPGRDRIQKEINKILKAGDFGIDSIELKPLSLDFAGENSLEGDETLVADNTTITNMTGRQMQNVTRIVRKFNKEELTFDQAAQLLKQGFGFDDEAIDLWLLTDNEEDVEAEEAAQEGEPIIKIE